MTKPFRLVSSELDREFQIHTEQGHFVALAPTAMPHSAANWDKKKITPKTLWESISTESERSAIKALLDEPGLTPTKAMVKLADLQIEFSSASRLTHRPVPIHETDGPCL